MLERVVGFIDVGVHAVHGRENVAAQVESLRLLLAAYLLNAVAGGVGLRAKLDHPFASLGHLLGRGAGRRRNIGGRGSDLACGPGGGSICGALVGWL